LTITGQTNSVDLEDDRDKRSIFVKNMHYSADKKEIEE
jgi:hypothetical protein